MSEKNKSIAKSAILVTAMMISFKVLGFVKQAFVAYYFGATVETDTYFIAWGFVSGVTEAIVKALGVSLVAIYTSMRLQQGKKEAERLINGLLEILVPVFTALALLLFLASPCFSHLLAPTYYGEKYSKLVLFIRVLSPILIFGCLELIFGAVLDSHKSFFVPRLQSLIYSLAIILACVFLSDLLEIRALVLGQYISSILFSVLLIYSVKKMHRFSVVKFKNIPGLKSILVTAIPLFIGNSALQINQMVDKSITSGLGDGAASALSYCHILEQFVTNIVIINIGNVMFANFAEFVAKEEKEKIIYSLSNAINYLIIVLTAISLITIVSAKDIVSIVYFRGSFTKQAVNQTSLALMGYAVSFVCVAVRDLSVKGLYAYKDTKKPMIISFICIAINICFSIILSKFIGILGISIATSISATIGMILVAKALKKYLVSYNYCNHIKTFLKCCPAAFVLVMVSIFLKHIIPYGAIIRFCVICFAGFLLYFGILYIQGIQEIRFIVVMLKNKIKNRKEKNNRNDL